MGRRGAEAQRTEDWEALCWKKLQRNVYRLQKRIYRAARQGDWKRVHKLQRLLLRSGRDPTRPGRVTWLLKQQRGRCGACGLPLTTEDVVEIHHRDGDRSNERRANLVLLHAHCHDQAHAGLYQ